MRSGTVVVLGAGASAEAGYPLASELLDRFKIALDEASADEVARRGQVRRHLEELRAEAADLSSGRKALFAPMEMRNEPTSGEWFEAKWEEFLAVSRSVKPLAVPKFGSDGRPSLSSPVVYGSLGVPEFPPYSAPVELGLPSVLTPYLETFFAFYDQSLRPFVAGDRGAASVATLQHRFRALRELAILVAFRALTAHGRPAATYLRRLFELRGPGGIGSALATLNLDVAVEQVAAASGIALYDGFATETPFGSDPPQEWTTDGLENLYALWQAVAKNGFEFQGFEAGPPHRHLLLKLHGSLGWYVLEEGDGDIGSRDELRYNTAYRHFRLPYEFFWKPDLRDLLDELAKGGASDPVTLVGGRSLSRKAGAVWVRPYLVFARALKLRPDRLSIALMATFANLLDQAATVLVIGYSWADSHVNDLIFDAVARGAKLVNISKSAAPETALALLAHRFPTTFHVLRTRLFVFGGGAKRVLEDNVVELPSGATQNLDLIASLSGGPGLPRELSLQTLG